MGSNVEWLLERWEDEARNQHGEIGLAFKGIANELREAIEADREEGIEVEVVRRWDNPNYAGTKEGQLQVRGLYGHGPEEGPYTLIKREPGDSEEEA